MIERSRDSRCIKRIEFFELMSTKNFYVNKNLFQNICKITNQDLNKLFCFDFRIKTFENVLKSSSNKESCSKPNSLVTLHIKKLQSIMLFFSLFWKRSTTIFQKQSKILANRVLKTQVKDFIKTIYFRNQLTIVKCWFMFMLWIFTKHWKRN